eukprot:Tamp_01702.p3 GENE.Tamp_01702~~Tamp_01702.p3  ORF type:complete len:389 (+),score=96.54 Tamp_01702:3845-5011(+)
MQMFFFFFKAPVVAGSLLPVVGWEKPARPVSRHMAGVVADEMEVVEEHGAAASKGGETPAVAALATPWVEKYRPETLGDVIAHTDIVSTLDRFVANNRLPHLLLYGPPGTGKTSTALALAKKIFGPKYKSMTLELNASDDRGIDVVKEKIKDFAGTRTIFGSGFKMILLDEADNMTNAAQMALRRIVESYTSNARFVLCCNYVNKIIPALQSRCTRFRFSPLESIHIQPRLDFIVKDQGVTATPEALLAVEKLGGGDMRKSLNILQSAALASDVITEESVYLCTGNPLPSDIKKIMHSLLNDTLEGAYEFVQDMQTERGLALIDIVRAIHAELIRFQLPPKTFARLLQAMSDLEYRLNYAVVERIQLGSFVAMWYEARQEAAVETTAS